MRVTFFSKKKDWFLKGKLMSNDITLMIQDFDKHNIHTRRNLKEIKTLFSNL